MHPSNRMRALFHLATPAACLLLLLISPAVASLSASFLPSCNVNAAFVLGSSVVALFNSSANCTFPFFPYLAAPPSLRSGINFSVTIIAIGGGGGGGI